jgi:hypothetical protein
MVPEIVELPLAPVPGSRTSRVTVLAPTPTVTGLEDPRASIGSARPLLLPSTKAWST